MRGPIIKGALSIGLTLAASSVARADPLKPFLNLARPVVVVADSPDDPKFRRQIAALEGRTKAVEDYDIAVVRVTTPDEGLRRALGVAPVGFAVALVGKDGSVKQRWTEPVDPARIFALIDRMPMRREEMRARR